MEKEKKCIFCDWERLYDEREKYDWDYVCPKCKIKCGLKSNLKMEKENKEIIEKVMEEVREDGIASIEGHAEETLDYNELDIREYLGKVLKLKNEKRKQESKDNMSKM